MLCAQSANFCCALPPDPTDRHCMGLRGCNNTGAAYSDHAHTFRVLFVLPIETKRSEASGIIKRKWNGTVRLKQSFQSNRSEPFAFRPKFWAGSRYTKWMASCRLRHQERHRDVVWVIFAAQDFLQNLNLKYFELRKCFFPHFFLFWWNLFTVG